MGRSIKDYRQRFEAGVHLSTVALLSFILSFAITRTFTTFFPSQVLIIGGYHIHHFWFGIAFLAVGGWLGINYRQKDVDIAAAILYGVGGALIMDEVGLLLTFGNYWTSLTWTILGVLLPTAIVLSLFAVHRKKITEELKPSKFEFALGIFLTVLAISFILQTNSFLVILASASLLVIGITLITVFIVRGRAQN